MTVPNENKYLDPLPLSKTEAGGKGSDIETPPITKSGSTENAGCEHCWHDTGILLCSDPPQTEEVCCFCGEMRRRRVWVLQEKAWHGKYKPSRVWV